MGLFLSRQDTALFSPYHYYHDFTTIHFNTYLPERLLLLHQIAVPRQLLTTTALSTRLVQTGLDCHNDTLCWHLAQSRTNAYHIERHFLIKRYGTPQHFFFLFLYLSIYFYARARTLELSRWKDKYHEHRVNYGYSCCIAHPAQYKGLLSDGPFP